MRLQLIRNATLRLTYAGCTLLIDPYLAPRHSLPTIGGHEPNPTSELPVPAEAVLEGVDLTLISHLHPDHFDPLAQQLLPSSMPILCQGVDVEALRRLGFTNVTPLEASWQGLGLLIERTPGTHGSGHVLPLMGEVMGFVLRAAGEPTVYWAGDTILTPAVLETTMRVQPEVIVTHSGGALWDGLPIIMDAEQTVAVCQAAPQATVVATHLEAVDHAATSRRALREAATAAGISPTQLRIPADGESLIFAAPGSPA
ncbi:MBL fold metallo-hydrolase [Deinococcus sp. HMF7620]|uniref:MBL fold metallo-hydrolase n=1 Tax=Deinococcus arboris TaxID=2682977 RepID=A0A7C9HWQ8_9DEIO|nr:MBL fold metallo-hydrolase [Deinococcus arboris]MVN85708.1 MBL fold metallo-hydrolase [Deinococcus arboris]